MVKYTCVHKDNGVHIYYTDTFTMTIFIYKPSVLPRLRFCAIVAQNFEYDAAKTVPASHLAHIDFGLSQDFESDGCVENSHAKNNIVFPRNSHSCNGYFHWCIGFPNCTGTSFR